LETTDRRLCHRLPEESKAQNTWQDGLKTMQIIDMAYQSAKINREVKLGELETF
jgi:hypothetical protein